MRFTLSLPGTNLSTDIAGYITDAEKQLLESNPSYAPDVRLRPSVDAHTPVYTEEP